MLGSKSFELIKDLERNHNIPAFNDDLVRQVILEIQDIYAANSRDARLCSTTGNRQLLPILSFRHAALERNKRCLLAFLYERLERIKDVRWEYGPTIPGTVKEALCEPEVQWFNNYNKILSTYMRSIGEGQGIDLTCDLEPPKSLFVQVRCLEDYGKLELDSGEVITLKKNSQHYLPRLETESLVKQGILERIN